ncbi:MAG: T9SS type A sorting domain-containing protein [Bacteroidetes bacterium]|nr:T9SS type A sorting domain-containing protein [Bacteroidota bacterium]
MCCGSSPFTTQTFSTTALVGDEDNNKENISSHEEHVTQLGVYPNPNNGEFQVVMMHVHQDDVKIQIYDMTGRLLLEQPATIMDMDFVENIKIPAGLRKCNS